MNKLWTVMLTMLVFASTPLQALAQEASSSLNGIWRNSQSEDLAFLTIIHKDDGQFAMIGAAYTDLVVIRGYLAAASLGEADPKALGDNIGNARSYPDLYYNAELNFDIHRPSTDELVVQLKSCVVPVGNTVDCSRIYENFPLDERVLFNRVF